MRLGGQFSVGGNIPPPDRDPEGVWQQLSPALNADRIKTPLLMQLSDTEFSAAGQLIAALDDRRKPIEVRVYPNEQHNAMQPIHKARIATRNIDWFRFWLANEVDPSPSKQDQYGRWNLLRAKHETDLAAPMNTSAR